MTCEWSRILKEIVFPNVCCFCGRTAAASDVEGICRSCAACLPLRSATDRIRPCVDGHHLLQMGRSLRDNFPVIIACRYEEPIRSAMVAMKFGEAAYFMEVFGSILALSVRQTGRIYDRIVPVPLHERRHRERGYDQAMLIARKLSEATGIPVDGSCLVRIRNTGRQSETTNRRTRIGNLSGAFVCASPEKLAGERILLLDDVLTTGATLFNAAEAIRTAEGAWAGEKGMRGGGTDITGIVLASDRKGAGE